MKGKRTLAIFAIIFVIVALGVAALSTPIGKKVVDIVETSTYDLTEHPFDSHGEAPISYQEATPIKSKTSSNSSTGHSGGGIGWDPSEVFSSSNMDGAGAVSSSTSSGGNFYNYTGTDKYVPISEGGFISTSDEPASTISADVDTASYCNVRHLLNKYEDSTYADVPKDSVRIEEMLNYFDYDYVAPDDGKKFAINSQIAECPWNKETKLMSLGFQAGELDQQSDAGSNLVFLVDVSGSMSNNESLPLFQAAFHQIVDQFDENDRISLVTYSGEEQIVLNGTNGADHEKIITNMDSLVAGGATNGEAGLKKAYALAKMNFINGGINRIVMVSDGDLNVGMSSTQELNDYVSSKRDEQVYLSVLGFGTGNYNDANMEAIADNGNGNYHYIDCIDELKKAFTTDLIRNTVPFANDVKVQVQFNPNNVDSYRLIGYENRTMSKNEFSDVSKDAGDVGPGSQFTVLYEVKLASNDDGKDIKNSKYHGNGSIDEIASVALRYKPVDGGWWTTTEEITSTVTSNDETNDPNNNWKFQAAVAETGMLLRDSIHAGTSNYDEVAKLLASATLTAEQEGFSELVAKLR